MFKKDCIFCQIAKGKAPAYKIWEDKKHLAFLSIFPNTPGFSVVITKEHHPSYAFQNSDKTLQEITLAAKKVGKLIDQKLDDVGRTAMVFEGFGVDHLHAKLIPLHGTANMEKWKPLQIKKKHFFNQYPGYIATYDHDKANEKELEELAKKIKS